MQNFLWQHYQNIMSNFFVVVVVFCFFWFFLGVGGFPGPFPPPNETLTIARALLHTYTRSGRHSAQQTAASCLKWDWTQEFHLMWVEPQSKDFTTFCLPVWQVSLQPDDFGLKNTAVTFQKAMEPVLHSCSGLLSAT